MHMFRTRRSSRARRLVIAGISGVAVFAGALAAVGSTGSGAAVAFKPTFFSSTATPAVASANDPNAVELGVKFSPDVTAYATGMRFYKGAGNTGVHTGTLWNSAGVAIRQVSFKNETASGWQSVNFPTPLKLVAHANYVVSYHAPKGHYSFTQSYFTKTIDNGTVKLPASTAQSGNAVYRYGARGFPTTSTAHATNYWVDLKLSATPPPSTTTTVPHTTGGWAGTTNTGVPAGIALTNYTGPTTITSCGVVINAKIVNSPLTITAGNGTRAATTPCVTIKNSIIKGEVHTGYASQNNGPVVLMDTEIAVPYPNSGVTTALDEANFYGWRLDIHGARHGVMCDGYCALYDSYVHDNWYVSGSHMDSFITNGNYGGKIVLDHNTFLCRLLNPAAGDGNGGCSADLGTFGDFSLVSNMIVTRNLFKASPDSAYCVYTGANEPSKPYARGTNLVWTNNVWERGTNRKCGWAGPVYDWAQNTGNKWCNNNWSDGGPVKPDAACI
jgi:hypothetical protein